MRKEIEKYIEDLCEQKEYLLSRLSSNAHRLFKEKTNLRIFDIFETINRLQSILDSCEEEDQINLDHFDIHTETIIKGHNHKSHNWHAFSPSVNYKSDWQRVNEAEADRIEASDRIDPGEYRVLSCDIIKGHHYDGVFGIKSIQRLSDGEVFSIGDKACSCSVNGVIKHFKEYNCNTLLVLINQTYVTLENLKKI